jgi:RNA 2',3'-cyclic 3'-phosphodiesterase
VRLFFAVELPSEVQRALGKLKPDDDTRDYRWSDPSLLHITLAFLGEQAEDRLPTLQEIGQAAASRSSGGMLNLGHAGSFGSNRAPRVLWVDVTGDLTALNGLQRHLESALRTSGFALEDRAFRAHITLARRRETARGGPPSGWPPSIRPTAFELRQLTLMQSRLSPRGPTYVPLFQFRLGG